MKPNEQSKTNQSQLITVVSELAQAQAEENDIRKKELEVETINIASNERVALETISAQTQDRQSQFALVKKLKSQEHFLIGLAIVGVLITVLYSLYKNDAEFAKEVLKSIVLVLGGYFAGYGKAQSKSVTPPQSDD